MPEPTAEFSSSGPVEIRNGSRYDVILNTRAGDQQEVAALAETVIDGLPLAWVSYYPPDYEGLASFYVDNPSVPNYLAKNRPYSDPALWTHARDHLLTPEDPRQKLNLENSILNEMILSPRIKEVLAGEEASQLAHEFGFPDIEFVEPLVGIIDKETRRKMLVYRFIKGSTANSTDSRREDKLSDLADSLKELLRKNNIDARDLRGRQLIESSDGKHLYFVDAAQFAKTQPKPTSG